MLMASVGNKYILANNIIFDPHNHSLLDQADNHNLTRLGSNESQILRILIESSPDIVTREDLHQLVWRDQGVQVDDSSLTQSISTLRKQLKDSTRSPVYIKTVPKRGYQFIAPFETNVPYSTPLAAENMTQNPHVSAEEISQSHSIVTENGLPTAHLVQVSKPTPWWAKLVWILAFLMPFLIFNISAPKTNHFTKIGVTQKIPMFATPASTIELEPWLALVNNCVGRYVEEHPEQKPSYVVVSGGQNESVAINYIFQSKEADLNHTQVIYTKDPHSKINPSCT